MDLAEYQYSVVGQHSDVHIVVEWPSDLGYPHLTSNQLPEWGSALFIQMLGPFIGKGAQKSQSRISLEGKMTEI